MALATALFIWATTAFAAEFLPFERSRFEAAQKGGRMILIDITAPRCPTCKAQKPVIEKLAAQPEFKELTIFTVDFDSQRQAVAALKASSQSTLIVFKGLKEAGRSVRDARGASIESLQRSAIS